MDTSFEPFAPFEQETFITTFFEEEFFIKSRAVKGCTLTSKILLFRAGLSKNLLGLT